MLICILLQTTQQYYHLARQVATLLPVMAGLQLHYLVEPASSTGHQ